MIVETSEKGLRYKWWVNENADEFRQEQDKVGPRRGHEEGILDFVINNLANKNKRFIDVGANVGYWAIRMTSHFKDVIAIEPETMNADVLLKNVHLNKIKMGQELLFFQDIVTSPEKIMSPLAIENRGGESRTVTSDYPPNLYKRTLDEYRPNYDMNCVIKIDTEGHEVEILKGATELLKDNSIFIIEDHEGVYPECLGHRKLIEEIMKDYGYQITLNFGSINIYMKC